MRTPRGGARSTPPPARSPPAHGRGSPSRRRTAARWRRSASATAGPIQGLEGLRDVGNIDPEAQGGGALPEAVVDPRGLEQPGTDQLIDSRAETHGPTKAQLVDGGGPIVIE